MGGEGGLNGGPAAKGLRWEIESVVTSRASLLNHRKRKERSGGRKYTRSN